MNGKASRSETSNVKRKRDDAPKERPQKRSKASGVNGTISTNKEVPQNITATTNKVKPPKKSRSMINQPPSTVVDLAVFGGNSFGELGLGSDSTSRSVTRPRFNSLLDATSAGIVQAATGSLHCIALTIDNKILTWGVNDEYALGRSTTWRPEEHGISNGNSALDNESDDFAGLRNPREATPTEIDNSHFEPGTIFTSVAASDHASFAVTAEGKVYGWGTFRDNNGERTWTRSMSRSKRPMLIPELSRVRKIVAGANHVLALTDRGAVLSWGVGDEHQLGRKLVERNKANGLRPMQFGLSKGIIDIAAGTAHSLALRSDGAVLGWGQNNYGQAGSSSDEREDGAGQIPLLKPTPIAALANKGKARAIAAGNCYSVVLMANGSCYTWGRTLDSCLGYAVDNVPAADLAEPDARGRVAFVKNPVMIPDHAFTDVSAGREHCIAVDAAGRAYAWGWNDAGRCGLGPDVETEIAPTLLQNTALRGRKVLWCVASAGQFSLLAAEPKTK